MFIIDLGLGAVLYAAAGLLLVVGTWLYCDRRDRLFYDRTRRRTTFHCLKCDHVYSHAGEEEVCPCPRCGHENSRLRF